MRCRLCGGETAPLFERTVLGKHRVGFHQCAACGLTQTDEPTWLGEAYVDVIHPTDTGILARNLGARRVVATFLHLSGIRDEPCLDYAGGYGIFTRLMRDAGFEYFWMDPYATNTLARGFEWTQGPAAPRAVTAFEVLEHLVRPLEEFKRIADLGANWIITSTELHPGPKPASDWHYLSVESGQHVAFYRPDTLERLGREAGYPHVTAGPFFQIFARKPFPAWKWQIAERLGAFVFPIVKKVRPSLTVSDCERIRSRLRGE
ncbi:MAG TPA: class I SAM-dependent methyltransferase [Candidatus Limnocylindrales bacterium]|jgi:hypothetical protein|nr:class I SAM-dependent methyltransferase [Candidatus Limnocylindrales bacterium]